MVRSIRYLIIQCLVFGLLMTGAALAGNPHIQCESSVPWSRHSIKVDVNSNQKANLPGVWIEVIEAISGKTGIQFRTSHAPYARVARNLEMGTIDISFLLRADQDNPNIIYSAYLFHYDFIAVPRHDVILKTYEDLSDKRIGIVGDFTGDSRFDSDTDLFKQHYQNYNSLVRMLIKGRLDVIAGNGLSVWYILRKQNYVAQIGQPIILKSVPIWVQFSSSSPYLELNEKIRIAVDELRMEKVFDRILQKYFK